MVALLFLFISIGVSGLEAHSKGVKIALSEDTILKYQHKYFTLIIDTVKKVLISDKEFNLETPFFNTNIEIKDIKLNLGNLKWEDFSINLLEDSIVLIKGTNIQVNGGFSCAVKADKVPLVSDSVYLNIPNFNIIIIAKLGMKSHPNLSERKTVGVTIIDVYADIDQNDLTSESLNEVKNYLEEFLKENLDINFQEVFKESFLQIINKIISDLIEEFPIYDPSRDQLIRGYSLIEEPKIENQALIFLIEYNNDSNNRSYDLPLNSQSLPRILSDADARVVPLNPFTITTAVYSLYYAQKLNYKYELPNIMDIVPENKYGFLDRINPLTGFRDLLKDKFGEQRKGQIEFSFSKIPQIKQVEKSKYRSNLELKVNLSVEKNNNKFEIFNEYLIDVTLEAKADSYENGRINGSIDKIKINKLNTVYNNLGQEVDPLVVKQIVNWGLEIGSQKYSQNLPIIEYYQPSTTKKMDEMKFLEYIQNMNNYQLGISKFNSVFPKKGMLPNKNNYKLDFPTLNPIFQNKELYKDIIGNSLK